MAPNGRIDDEEREKNPLVYAIGGFRTAHRIQSCSTSRNPHLDSALDAPEFILGWIGWDFNSTMELDISMDKSKIKRR